MKKYLKTWMGTVSGSMGGRNDGYPERKFAVVDTLDELVETYDPEAEYFRLEPVNVSAVVQVVKDLAP